MSQENVQIVRVALGAINTNDPDALLDLAAPGFEYDVSRAIGPWGGVFSPDELRRVWKEYAEAWESFRYEADEFIETGDHVVTPFTNLLRGRDGIEVRARAAVVWTIRDGAITRICFYQKRQDALEAVGLSE